MSTHSVLSKSLRALRTLDPEIYVTINDASYGVSIATDNYMIDINSPSDGVMYVLDPAHIGDALTILDAGQRNVQGRVRDITSSLRSTDMTPLGEPVITLSGDSLSALLHALQHRFIADGRPNIECVRIETDDDGDAGGEMLRVVSTNGHGMFVHGVHASSSMPAATVIHNKVVGLITDLTSARGALPLELLIDVNGEVLFSLMSGDGDVITIRSHLVREGTTGFPKWRGVLVPDSEDAQSLDDFVPLLHGVRGQQKHMKKLDRLFFCRVDGAPALMGATEANELHHVITNMAGAPIYTAMLSAVEQVGPDTPGLQVITCIAAKYVLDLAAAVVAAQVPVSIRVVDRNRPIVVDAPSTPELHALVMPMRGDEFHVVQGLYAVTVCE